MRAYTSRLLSQPTLESIRYQNTELFDKLTKIMASLLSRTPSLKIIKETGIEKLIKDELAMTIEVSWKAADDINAHVIAPMLDRNHTLFHPMWKPFLNGDDMVKLVHALGKPILTGTVDRASSKLGGDFSKVVIPVCFYRGLFSSKVLTAQEIAAILLHELGHGFTYFECLSDLATRNYAIAAATAQFLGAKDAVTKTHILREIDTKLGIEIPNKELLATKEIDQVYTVITVETMKRTYSELGSSLYDTRTWEALADQFASRHGAHIHLTSALDKIYRRYGDRAYYSTPKFLLVEVVKVVSVVMLLVLSIYTRNLGLLLAVFNILISNPFTDTYDRPKDRITRIREDLIGRLRERDITDHERRSIIEDTKFIDDVLLDMKNRDTFWQSVWKYLSSDTSSQVAKMEFYKKIESLANNNLYLLSAKLKTM